MYSKIDYTWQHKDKIESDLSDKKYKQGPRLLARKNIMISLNCYEIRYDKELLPKPNY